MGTTYFKAHVSTIELHGAFGIPGHFRLRLLDIGPDYLVVFRDWVRTALGAARDPIILLARFAFGDGS